MKSSGIGGQAVIEGVMMQNQDVYAVAVRKPDGEIEVAKDTWQTFTKKHKAFNIPFVRGIFNFIDSMRLGMKILTFSASFYEEEEEKGTEETRVDDRSRDEKEKSGKDEKKESLVMGLAMALAVVLGLGIFFVLPMFLSNLFRRFVESRALMGLIEGVIRLAIFMGYVLLISLMKDIRRVFMYHGAEHKCINCVEHGLDLTVENVRKSSKQHKRCGTSFLLFVVFVSILFSMVIQVDVVWLKALLRILLIPVIAGISYEILKLAGRSDNWLINLISKPGLMLQGLTTREPEDDMIEVAIRSVEEVFDWRAYQSENFGKTFPGTEEEGEAIEETEASCGERLSGAGEKE
ncbi:MAG: DUF1385 domain-containing protein [Lachnospiraceae bacterium]|nr:DUF1385 domain-containing protein [Lachnospiraceae bacterium]